MRGVRPVHVACGRAVLLVPLLVAAAACSGASAWRDASKTGTREAYEAFLGEHPESEFAPQAQARIRAIDAAADWPATAGADTVEAYEDFRARFPNSAYDGRISQRLRDLRAPDAWRAARATDTIDAYNVFLHDFGGSSFDSEARARRSVLRGEAIVVLDSPAVMSPWSSFGSRYRWEATFREAGGKSGFRVSATDFRIIGPSGTQWTNSWTTTVTVRPGGSATTSYWIDKSDKWAGGRFHCVWAGSDDKGTPIRLLHEVRIP